jgi:hypothetical protein
VRCFGSAVGSPVSLDTRALSCTALRGVPTLVRDYRFRALPLVEWMPALAECAVPDRRGLMAYRVGWMPRKRVHRCGGMVAAGVPLL